jgi:hypothetical protein
VKKHVAALAGITAGGLPERVKDLAAFARPFLPADAANASTEDMALMAGQVVGAALAVWLHDHETPMRCVPGSAVSFHLGADEIQPFAVIPALTRGQLSAEAWQTLCAAFGIAGLDSGEATGDAAAT